MTRWLMPAKAWQVATARCHEPGEAVGLRSAGLGFCLDHQRPTACWPFRRAGVARRCCRVAMVSMRAGVTAARRQCALANHRMRLARVDRNQSSAAWPSQRQSPCATWRREAGERGGRVDHSLQRQCAFEHLLPCCLSCVLRRAQSGGCVAVLLAFTRKSAWKRPPSSINPAFSIGLLPRTWRFSSAAAARVMEVFGHRILATGTQGLAAQQPPARKQTAAPGPESNDRNACIIGATGVKATTLSQQGAEPALVAAEQKKQYSSQDNSRY